MRRETEPADDMRLLLRIAGSCLIKLDFILTCASDEKQATRPVREFRSLAVMCFPARFSGTIRENSV
jgi:hypothetical protein